MKDRLLHSSAFVVLAAMLLLSGCGVNDSAGVTAPTPQRDEYTGDGPIRVVCTTNIIKDLVRQIGRDRVQVTAIMDGPSIDPHSYTPSPGDTNLLTSADLVVYSGLHLEGQFDAALESLVHRGIPVVCVTEGLQVETPSRLLKNAEGAADPHVWFDPELWGSCGRWLAIELSAFDPSYADSYAESAAEFMQQMQETKTSGESILSAIPADRRVLVTAHDAFEYFARAFDFEVEAVQGISTESEPGVRRINQLVELLVSKKVSAVFTEQSVSEKNIQALVAGCAAAGHTLTIGATLFSDTAGAEGTAEATLSGALQHNIRQITTALTAGGNEQP